MTGAARRLVAGALGLGVAGALVAIACSPPPPIKQPSPEVFVPSTTSSSPAPVASLARPEASTAATGGACHSDADCVPAQCCHPSTCVASSEAPTCADTRCTRDCRGGSFECGAGACACKAGVCAVDWRTPPPR